MKIKSLLCIILLSSSMTALAQTETSSSSNYGLPKKSDFDRWSVGISFGASNLLGDLLKGSQNNSRFLESSFVKPA